jgi:hypothetical protein
MIFSRLSQLMSALSVVIAFAAQASAQQSPVPAADSVNAKEFADRKETLLQVKNVNAWPAKDTIFVVPLTVKECTFLGGSVSYWASCGTTNMKCTGSNGHEMCIDEVK